MYRRCVPRRVMCCFGVIVREVPVDIPVCLLTCGMYSRLNIFSCIYALSALVLLYVACHGVVDFLVVFSEQKCRCRSTVALTLRRILEAVVVRVACRCWCLQWLPSPSTLLYSISRIDSVVRSHIQQRSRSVSALNGAEGLLEFLA